MMTLIVTEVIFPIMDFAQTNYCISAKVTTLANLPSVELQRGIRNEMIDKKFPYLGNNNNKTITRPAIKITITRPAVA